MIREEQKICTRFAEEEIVDQLVLRKGRVHWTSKFSKWRLSLILSIRGSFMVYFVFLY